MSLSPQIVSLIRLLRRDLDAIGRQLKGIHRVLGNHEEMLRADSELERTKEHGPIEVRALVRSDEESVRVEKANQERNHRTPISIKNAAWCALFAASIYAGGAV